MIHLTSVPPLPPPPPLVGSSTMGSWGFDVNRSTNLQIPSSLAHSNNNMNYNEQQTMIKTKQDVLPMTSQFSIPRPTLSRQYDGNEFAAIDRLVHGPTKLSSHLSSKESSNEQSNMIANNHLKSELIAWQNRMLEKDRKFQNVPSPKFERPESARKTPVPPAHSIRPASAVSNLTENQRSESDHHEPMIKTARVVKRYIELLYHLQTFYQRILDQLFNDSTFLQVSPTIFNLHCRRISEQIRFAKPIWDEKLMHLQQLLKDVTKFRRTPIQSEVRRKFQMFFLSELEDCLFICSKSLFLQRALTLLNLMHQFEKRKDLDSTNQTIYSDIDRLFHEEKLAIQLQDELSTLLQHQSLLNEFIQLFQWNLSIYSMNDRKRVENVLSFLREQMSTTEQYLSHVNQQLTEVVNDIRSTEKYILSYTNTMPILDETGFLTTMPEDQNDFLLEQKQMQPDKNHRREIKTSQTKSHSKIATVRPTRHDNSPKSPGILKPNQHRNTSMDRINGLDVNTIGDEISKLDDFDRSMNGRNSNGRQISRSRSRDATPDSNISEEDLHSSYRISHSNGYRPNYERHSIHLRN